MKPISKLGVGPMSPEVVEAVFRFSENSQQPLMLIASRSQIDWDKGYVNDWTTQDYIKYVNLMKKQYPQAKVYICRDHCGPGFKPDDSMSNVYNTIDTDLDLDFDLIHIDFCHHPGYRNDVFEESKKAIAYILSRKPKILLEVGTDENSGVQFSHQSQGLKKVANEMKFFTNIAPIHFFVCQTGSLVKEINQVGKFNNEFMKQVKDLARAFDVNLKEHNADYIDTEKIKQRKNIMDALNVAPQYGFLQTEITIQKANTYGIDTTDFLNDSYNSKKWEKWLFNNDQQNKYLCSLIAGHYNFTSTSYKKIYENISKYEDFRESIILEMMKNINMYINSL